MKAVSTLLTLFFATNAHAISIESAFAGVDMQNSACFAKSYSAEHLAQHPNQTVRNIKVKLWRQPLDGMESMPVLGIQVIRKNETRAWTNNISCMDYQNQVLCAVECDGGSVNITKREIVRQQDTLVLKNNGVLLYGGCDDQDGNEETIFLDSKKGGDDIFVLPAADEKVCADVSKEMH